MNTRARWGLAAGLGAAVVLVLGMFLGYLLNDLTDDYDFIQKVPTATGAPVLAANPGAAATPVTGLPMLVIAATPGANMAVAVDKIEHGGSPAAGSDAPKPVIWATATSVEAVVGVTARHKYCVT